MWTKCYFWTCFCLPLTFFSSFSCLFFLFLPKAPQEARFLPSSTCGGMRALWLVSRCCSDRSVFLSPTGDVGGYFQAFKAGYPRVIQVHLHVNTYLIKTEDQNGEERRFQWLWTRHGRLSDCFLMICWDVPHNNLSSLQGMVWKTGSHQWTCYAF